MQALAELIAEWPTGDWQTASTQDRLRRLVTTPNLDIAMASLGEPALRVDGWDRLRAQGAQAVALPQLTASGMEERRAAAANQVTQRLATMAAERAAANTATTERPRASK